VARLKLRRNTMGDKWICVNPDYKPLTLKQSFINAYNTVVYPIRRGGPLDNICCEIWRLLGLGIAHFLVSYAEASREEDAKAAKANSFTKCSTHVTVTRKYLLYSNSAEDANVEYLVCPRCDRRVQKVFAFAVDEPEADDKFNEDNCACGYCTASVVADKDMNIIKSHHKCLVYWLSAKVANVEYLVCPRCQRRVQKLFTFAINNNEAGDKFHTGSRRID
jgi:hypothetical protein